MDLNKLNDKRSLTANLGMGENARAEGCRSCFETTLVMIGYEQPYNWGLFYGCLDSEEAGGTQLPCYKGLR